MEVADLLNVPSESVNILFKNKRSKITKEKKNLVCIFFLLFMFIKPGTRIIHTYIGLK